MFWPFMLHGTIGVIITAAIAVPLIIIFILAFELKNDWIIFFTALCLGIGASQVGRAWFSRHTQKRIHR